jgi:hypothetical protein
LAWVENILWDNTESSKTFFSKQSKSFRIKVVGFVHESFQIETNWVIWDLRIPEDSWGFVKTGRIFENCLDSWLTIQNESF